MSSGFADLQVSFFDIDTVYTDQGSLSERAAQVALMGKIFSFSTVIVAWPRLQQINHLDPDQVEKTDNTAIEAFADILNQEYWSRMQIIQELFLALQIAVGNGKEFAYCDILRRVTQGHWGDARISSTKGFNVINTIDIKIILAQLLSFRGELHDVFARYSDPVLRGPTRSNICLPQHLPDRPRATSRLSNQQRRTICSSASQHALEPLLQRALP